MRKLQILMLGGVVLTLMCAAGLALAQDADPGVQAGGDGQGDRIDARLDRRGDRIDHRFDRGGGRADRYQDRRG